MATMSIPRSALHPRTRVLAMLVVLVALTTVACVPGQGTRPVDRLTDARSFAFAIGGDAESLDATLLGRYGLVVVDGEGVTESVVDALHAEGSIVLAYVSVGTIESYRSWYDEASPYKLELWDDWGEWYADTSQAGFRDLITGTVVPPMLAKGVDGLFLDNVDMITDHEAQASGMYVLVEALGSMVHRDGRILFAQNGEEIVDPLLDVLDGWNREDVTSTYDFDTESYRRVPADDSRYALDALQRIRAAGVFTTATDYTASATSAIATESTANACAAGALSFVSNIGLTRIPATPATCP
jgi:cysteinyl-tRNA synthetase, unknown class